jgi:hypothetical protein
MDALKVEKSLKKTSLSMMMFRNVSELEVEIY